MSYARGTLAALVDALVPATPEPSDWDNEHVLGALDADVDKSLVKTLDDFVAVRNGPWALLGYETVPLSSIVAVLLDFAALELLVRQQAEEGLRSPEDAFAGGPFSRLSCHDRLRAIRLLETDGLLARVGAVHYLVQVVLSTILFTYYSDWGGSEQGWKQTGYPGPADGYAVLLGYEVDDFEENDY